TRADDTQQGGGGGRFQRVGPFSFVSNDTKQFAEWGFDYLKYDWNPIDVPNTKIAYDLMRASGRDIVFSLSNSARLNDAAGLAQYSQLWRTSGDMSDTWGAIRQNAFDKAAWAPFQGPGHWADEDMLVVGRVSVGEELHPTRLTPNEQVLHITQWCLLASPLLIGCDLAALDPFTLSLLTNDEVLDVDQDPLGKMGQPVRREDTREVWSKPLEDGSVDVGLYNLGEDPQTIRVDWKELGLAPGNYRVRDLWRQKDVARSTEGYRAKVGRHGAALLRIFR
ncbi:glycoside hydrolase family 27 protein, partial [bacterium]